MKAYYYETEDFNGVLLVDCDGRWITYGETVCDFELIRENIPKMVLDLSEFDDRDFNDFWVSHFNNCSFVMDDGKNTTAADCLDSFNYYERIV